MYFLKIRLFIWGGISSSYAFVLGADLYFWDNYFLNICLCILGGQVFPQDMPLYWGRASISPRQAFVFGEDNYFLKVGLCIWGGKVFPQDMPLYFGEDFEIYFPLHYTGSGGVSGDNQSFPT